MAYLMSFMQNIGVARMANKACAGLAFKIFNTSMGFVSSHFASDSSGKTRLARRKEVGVCINICIGEV